MKCGLHCSKEGFWFRKGPGIKATSIHFFNNDGLEEAQVKCVAIFSGGIGLLRKMEYVSNWPEWQSTSILVVLKMRFSWQKSRVCQVTFVTTFAALLSNFSWDKVTRCRDIGSNLNLKNVLLGSSRYIYDYEPKPSQTYEIRYFLAGWRPIESSYNCQLQLRFNGAVPQFRPIARRFRRIWRMSTSQAPTQGRSPLEMETVVVAGCLSPIGSPGIVDCDAFESVSTHDRHIVWTSGGPANPTIASLSLTTLKAIGNN